MESKAKIWYTISVVRLSIKGILKPLKKLPKKYLIIILVLFFGIGGFFFFRNRNNEPLAYHTVAREEIKSTVSASGILKGKDTVNLKFPSGGRLSYLQVREGDTVYRGQALAGLDTRDLSIALQQARNTLREKQAIVDKIHDDVKDHSGDESFSQKQSRTSAEVAKDNAYDSVRAAESAFRNSVITSPISGIVTSAPYLPGQFVSGADIIVQVSDNSQVYFDAEIDESDIGKVTSGQKAEVTLNNLSELTILGDVEKILPSVKTSSSGSTVVIVRIKLPKEQVSFVSGVNGQATIITNKKTGLAIPYETLTQGNKVYRIVSGKPQLVEVKTGLESDNNIEVLEGLSESDQIVTNPESIK